MSRYIDMDKFRKNEIARCHCVPCVGSNDNNYKDLDEVLNDAPTADVVEVVRCKDCIWWEARACGDTVGKCENPRNGLVSEYTDDTDYCSYGERREK